MDIEYKCGPLILDVDESSQMLRKVQTEYQQLGSIVGTAQKLITKLNQRDLTDKLLIGFGLLVYILVVLYIVKQRLWNPFNLFFSS